MVTEQLLAEIVTLERLERGGRGGERHVRGRLGESSD